jgi:hypothetical protein
MIGRIIDNIEYIELLFNNKLKSTKNVEVIYTKIEDVYKTNIAGSVLTYKSKVIVV